MSNQKNFLYESIFFISLIGLLIYLVAHYISLSTLADEDMITINKMRNDKELNEAKSAFGGLIHKTKGDSILKQEKGNSITLYNLMYQSCLRFGMASYPYNYFAVNGVIVKPENNEPFRDSILKECYKKPYDNTVTFYYSE